MVRPEETLGARERGDTICTIRRADHVSVHATHTLLSLPAWQRMYTEQTAGLFISICNDLTDDGNILNIWYRSSP